MRRFLSVTLLLSLLALALYVGRERQRATEPPPIAPGPVLQVAGSTASEAEPEAEAELPTSDPEPADGSDDGSDAAVTEPLADVEAPSRSEESEPIAEEIVEEPEPVPDDAPVSEVTPEVEEALAALAASDDPALAVVRSFYEYLNAGDAAAAYELVGQEWRDFMTFDEFSLLYQNTREVRFIGLEVVEQSADRTTVGLTAEVFLAGFEQPTTWRLYFTVAEEEGELRLLAPLGQLF